MAFSKSPTADTYSAQPLGIVHSFDAIPGNGLVAGTQVAGMTNVLPFNGDISKDQVFGETRDGIYGYPVVSGGSTVCRGSYVWEKTVGTLFYYVVVSNGTNSYVYTSLNLSVWTQVTTLSTNATTPVRFCEFIDSTNTKKLVMVDGIQGYVFTSDAAGTLIVDADFPTPHVPFPVFIDGYLFLAKANTGDIYNSNLDDPAVWTAGNFISSELYADDIQALVRVNNYILAIGTQGSEYFYDAGNATGSPLARYDAGVLPFGTAFPNSIACNKDTIVLLTNNNDGELLFRIIEDFKYVDLPAGAVLQYLLFVYTDNPAFGTNLRSFMMRQRGRLFYTVNLNGISTSTSATHNVFTVNLENKMWASLTYSDASKSFPVYFTNPANSANSSTYCAGHYGGAVFFGSLYTNAIQDKLDIGQAGVDVVQQLLVPPQMFGTMNRKYMSRFGLNYYKTAESASGLPTMSYSDDGMQTFSTARSLAGNATGTSAADGGFPFITQLGSFRQRGFKITAASTRIRWYAAEVDINKGQQ